MPAGTLSFILLADAHLQGGDRRALPQLVDRLCGLTPPPEFAVTLGDAIYGLPQDDALTDARLYQAEIARLPYPHYSVLGNHDLKPFLVHGQAPLSELLACWEVPHPWYAFDQSGWRGLVLNTWSKLPEEELTAQLTWLERELTSARGPVVVFSHEAIGFRQGDLAEWLATDNTAFWPAGNDFERLLSAHADRVAGVFVGHKHRCLQVRRGGVNYHLMAAAHLQGGQAAQVALTLEGSCTVTAIGPLSPGPDDPPATHQQSYTLPAQ
jgi:predicted MPP superfamily phosphohydrolase